jgi:hypothetical protein
MSVRLSTAWMSAELERMKKFQRDHTDYEIVLSLAPAIKWVIGNLVDANIPFKLIRYGAGVTKITTKTDVCPKCGGLGRC